MITSAGLSLQKVRVYIDYKVNINAGLSLQGVRTLIINAGLSLQKCTLNINAGLSFQEMWVYIE